MLLYTTESDKQTLTQTLHKYNKDTKQAPVGGARHRQAWRQGRKKDCSDSSNQLTLFNNIDRK